MATDIKMKQTPLFTPLFKQARLFTPLFIFIILLFLSQSVCAYWSEEITVYIVDNKGRALKDAIVTVVYQSSACDKHGEINKKTDAAGKATLKFSNYVSEIAVVDGCVERYYTIIGSYAGAINSTMGYVDKTEKTYFIFLPIVKYDIYVQGYNNMPLPGSYISYDTYRFESNANGRIRLFVAQNKKIEATLVYGDMIKTLEINVAEDSETIVQLPVYDLHVRLFNENGDRISGFVKVGDLQLLTTETKDAVFEKFAYEYAIFYITVNKTTREISSKIDSDILNLYIDLTSPRISDVSVVQTAEKNLKITASAIDSGQYSLGLSGNPKIKYSLLGTTTEIWAKMYLIAPNKFESTILTEGKDIEYSIIAEDAQGNIAVSSGKFSFGEEKEEKEEKNGITITQTQISLPHIFGLIVFVFIIVIIYKKIREEL